MLPPGLLRAYSSTFATGCEILAKAEFLNPGGSVKDRVALAIVNDAVAAGRLQPGGLITEGERLVLTVIAFNARVESDCVAPRTPTRVAGAASWRFGSSRQHSHQPTSARAYPPCQTLRLPFKV